MAWTPQAAQERLTLAARALKLWGPRQYRVAVLVAVGFAALIGVATVIIPNPWFSREIATVWWNYPVWILTAIGAGLLAATYMRPAAQGALAEEEAPAERKATRMGIAGGVLSWFAVGCPVCNKIALLALGYSGAITWFAPLQPILAVAALVLTGVALVWRLSGQIACPVRVAA
ncbi:hypothetical protein FB468_1524 [Leucobacter komagatae]|uniref:Uncharacterized protein n=1 Tax=Leucobacter komagatae TaxID=55969 RepID=A0A542Y5X8_9MICO|nr:hypothetical protein [Leucobacter komagatae]TQL43502.1 hypothetical protein FB468_1524 [Leucobacter komagatae]